MKEITGFEAQDIEENKVIAALAYLIFFLPLLAAPKSRFGKFHANQALWIFLGEVLVAIISNFPLIGGLVGWALNVALFVLAVYMAYNAYSGKALELPVVGNVVIFK
jgi:uncharacterized membrane protein